MTKISGNNTRKEFNRLSTKNSCTRNITHIRKVLQSEIETGWWGSPLVQEEKYQKKKRLVIREEITIITLNQ
jgi:hypothetical protein